MMGRKCRISLSLQEKTAGSEDTGEVWAKCTQLEACDRYLRAGTAEEKKQIAQEHREKIRTLCEASENGIDAQEQAEVWTWIEEHAGEPDLLKTLAGRIIQSA